MLSQEELREKKRRNSIDPLIYYDEQWIKINILDLRPIYWISTYGRVYNEETNFIMEGHIVDNGYVVVSFKQVSGKRIYCHVHRLMMLMFCPIENSELFVVNHKDGIKTNNFIWNLEWATQKENVEHAFTMGLRGYGENSAHVVFTDEQVHLVCKCMEQGMNIDQLSNFVFDTPPTQQIRTLCINIYSRKFWRHISCNYDIDNYKRNCIFSINQVNKICELLSRDINMSSRDILSNIGITNYTKEEFVIYGRTISSIRKGKSFRYISDNYNIQY